jgi:hypothetical protein
MRAALYILPRPPMDKPSPTGGCRCVDPFHILPNKRKLTVAIIYGPKQHLNKGFPPLPASGARRSSFRYPHFCLRNARRDLQIKCSPSTQPMTTHTM